MSLFNWSETASNNATADASVNWREGMSPSGVNDSGRAMMAAVAKYRNDISGVLAATGTASAYAVSSRQNTGGTLYDGFRISFRAPASNSGAVTLAVDGSTAAPLRIAPGVDCWGNLLNAGSVYSAVYVAATGEWLLDGYLNQGVPTGTPLDWFLASPPPGWLFIDGRTIGNATSSATSRANADTWNLFNVLWGSTLGLTVSGGRGASAAADFAASKQLSLPDTSGRIMVGADNMSGTARGVLTTATTLGAALGEQSHALTAAENGPHAHGVTDGGHVHGVNDPGHAHYMPENLVQVTGAAGYSIYSGAGVNAASDLWSSSAGTGISIQSHTTGISIQNNGSGTAHNNVQPSIVVNKIIKL